MYCVFNESRVSWGMEYHVRQMKEDKAGNRYPLVDSRKQSFIKAKNGLFYGIINDNEVIAISDDIEVVEKRLKHAESSIEYTVYDADRKRRYKTIGNYQNSLLPVVYRITSSNTKEYGLIIAMNSIRQAEHSKIRLFYDIEDLLNYFGRLKSKNYFVHLANHRDISHEDKKRMGGIDALDIPREWWDVADLRAAIEARQRAGSHEAYIEQKKQSKTSASRRKIHYFDGDVEWEELEDEVGHH